ncbi:hypothetical protein BH09BAC1_BH09BAC1_26540 [soil metagenome]
MAFEVVVSAKAAIEIEDAMDWYHRISPDLALDLFVKYVEARKAIKLNPLLFQEHKEGYRKAILERFPYKLVFKVVDENKVLVVAFAHNKQRNYWRKR